MANIKPMLDRTTKIQRQVNGDLQWRVIVYDGTLSKQVERLAVGLTEAWRPKGVLGPRRREPALGVHCAPRGADAAR